MNAIRYLKYMAALSLTFCYASDVQFSVCQNSRKGLSCNMTCQTIDFQQPINFKCNGTSRGSCTPPFGCGLNLHQEQPNTTIFTIPSLSYSNDIGEWTCSYGSTNAPTQNLTVFGNPSPNITKTNIDANEEDVETVELTAVLECAYPSPFSIILEFDEDDKEPYQKFKTVQPSSSVLGQCISDLESIVTTEVKASYDDIDYKFAGKTGYLRINFFYTSDVEFITSSIGPFTFKACTSSFPCGFLPVWLILILIDVVICILVWKKVLKIGGFFKKKKIIIAIFFGVAIVAMVIGVILGIFMKCPNCGITVVASIAIGLFIAIVQWIFIMFWICKKEYYRAVIKITRETYADDLGDCKSEAYKDLSCRVTKAIESLYKNVEGRQTVVEVNFSPGLKVTFDLGSQGFSDCSVLSDTLEIALQSGLISPFEVSSDGFKFMPLKDWKDSKGETSGRSNGDRARSPASASAVKVEAE